MILEGAEGVGKMELARACSVALGTRLVVLSCAEDSSPHDLVPMLQAVAEELLQRGLRLDQGKSILYLIDYS